jgi:predicted Zn-dependent peptidase
MVADPFSKLRRIHYVWPSAKAFSQDDIGLVLLADVLARRPTGRLWRTLAGNDLDVQDIEAYQVGQNDSGQFHVYVDLAPQTSLAEVEFWMNNELARIGGSDAPSNQEIEQAQAALNAAIVTSLESLAGRGEWMQSFNHYLGNPDGFSWLRGIVQAAGPAWLADLAARNLRNARVEILTVPSAAKAP